MACDPPHPPTQPMISPPPISLLSLLFLGTRIVGCPSTPDHSHRRSRLPTALSRTLVANLGPRTGPNLSPISPSRYNIPHPPSLSPPISHQQIQKQHHNRKRASLVSGTRWQCRTREAKPPVAVKYDLRACVSPCVPCLVLAFLVVSSPAMSQEIPARCQLLAPMPPSLGEPN
jgi:hypothetical protein